MSVHCFICHRRWKKKLLETAYWCCTCLDFTLFRAV